MFNQVSAGNSNYQKGIIQQKMLKIDEQLISLHPQEEEVKEGNDAQKWCVSNKSLLTNRLILSRFSTCEFLSAKRICYCLNWKELIKKLVSLSQKFVRQKICANQFASGKPALRSSSLPEIVDFLRLRYWQRIIAGIHLICKMAASKEKTNNRVP